MPYELVEIFMFLFVFLDAFNKPARGLSLLYSLYCEVSGEYMFIGTFQTFPFNSSGGKGIFFTLTRTLTLTKPTSGHEVDSAPSVLLLPP